MYVCGVCDSLSVYTMNSVFQIISTKIIIYIAPCKVHTNTCDVHYSKFACTTHQVKINQLMVYLHYVHTRHYYRFGEHSTALFIRTILVTLLDEKEFYFTLKMKMLLRETCCNKVIYTKGILPKISSGSLPNRCIR